MSRRIRIGVRAVLIGLIASAVTAIAPGLASAGNIIPCPSDIDDAELRGRDIYFLRYTVLSSTPVFKVSDGRILNNGTSVPVEQTITSTVSTTVRVVVTVGLEAKLTEEFKATVSSQIEASRTTAIGVSIKATVPPNSNLIAEYGGAVVPHQFRDRAVQVPRKGQLRRIRLLPPNHLCPDRE